MSDFLLGVSQDRVISQFSDWLYSTPFRPRHSITIIADGKIHRYPIERDKGGATSGAYTLYMDGCPAGFAMDWHDSSTKITWKYHFDAEERREFGRSQHNPETLAKSEAERREAERRKAEELRRHEEIVRRHQRLAFAEWNYADLDILKHPYLRSRFCDLGIIIPDNGKYGIFRTVYASEGNSIDYTRIIRFPLKYCTATLPGGKCERGQLLVPMIDIATDSFRTLIRVMAKPTPEGKYLKPNYPVIIPTGSAFILAPNDIEQAESLFICEGFCTGLAIFVDLRGHFPVFSVGGCNNLLPVCQALRKRYIKKKIIIVADNDKNNAGINAAMKCKNAGLADCIKIPEIAGHDWYDDLALRVKKGVYRHEK